MTTTLRPLEPERRGSGGSRGRCFAVCVNSRRVGEISVRAHRRFGVPVGELSKLRVDEADRRRGRGTVAVLAAEEVLRGWGCGRVVAVVPGGSAEGLRLISALGYAERNRTLAKPLPDVPPRLPVGTQARAITEAEYPAWYERERARYIGTWVATGVPEEQAREKADADCRASLPDGVGTPETALRVLSHAGTDVGTLWLAFRSPREGSGREGFVYSVQVDEEHRGRGHGRALMLLAERESLGAGMTTLALNVFTANTPALRLYESLGYQVAEHCFAKPLL